MDLSAIQLLASMARGEATAEAVVAAHLDRIHTEEPTLRAFLHVDEDAALAAARRVDARRRGGEPLGRLAGIPVAIKDAICTNDQITSCGSKILHGFRSPYDAHVISRLRDADAILIGKTNLDEFAMGSSTENSGFYSTANPWDYSRTPGGSSGGSAAAVAAGEAPLALGSDTGGSIRQPASFCGVVGVKPSYGRVSRYGLIAFASSLDQIGPFARDVRDAALLLEVIAGPDPRDSTCVNRPVPAYVEMLDQPQPQLTVGVVREYFGAGLDPEVDQAMRTAIDEFRRLGATVREVSLSHTPHAVSAYYVIATAEASSNLARYDGVHFGHRAREFDGFIDMMKKSRGEGFGPEVKRRIMLGTYVLSAGYRDAYYNQALKVRRLIKEDFDRAFAECDVLIGPTTPTPAFPLGEKANDPLAMYLSDIYTIGGNLAGICGVSLPCGFTGSGLPIGLQLQAAAFEEAKLLRTSHRYERATRWHERRAGVECTGHST